MFYAVLWKKDTDNEKWFDMWQFNQKICDVVIVDLILVFKLFFKFGHVVNVSFVFCAIKTIFRKGFSKMKIDWDLYL